MRRQKDYWVVSLVALIAGAGLYGFTLSYPFVFDDLVYLVENPLVQSTHNFSFPLHLGDFIRTASQAGLPDDLPLNFITRPVCYLTFHANYVSGGMAPSGFRLLNICIHVANALIVWHLLTFMVDRSLAPKLTDSFSCRFIPGAASLFFLVHPLQSESVTYVIQRFTSLGSMFFLSAVLLHLRSIEQHGWQIAVCRVGSLICLVLGMLTKEFVFVAPLAMVLLDVLFLRRRIVRALGAASLALACMPLIPVLLFLVSSAQHPDGGLSSVVRIAAGPMGDQDHWRYVLTQPGVILGYLRLLLVPLGLNLDPDVAPVLHWTDPRLVGSVSLLAGLGFITAWWSRCCPGDSRASLVLGGECWFLLTASVDSSIIPLPDYMAEHRAYLPSVGFFLAIATLLDLLRARFAASGGWSGPCMIAVTSFLAILLAFSTIQRNRVWRSSVRLWEDTVSKSPNKGRVILNYGNALLAEGQSAMAEEQYRRVIEVEPGNTAAYNNLSTLQIRSGRHREALVTAGTGVKLPPTIYHHLLFYNIGTCHAALREWNLSVTALDGALNLAPNHTPTHFLLGQVHVLSGRYAQARTHFCRALELGHPEPLLPQYIQELESVAGSGADSMSN